MAISLRVTHSAQTGTCYLSMADACKWMAETIWPAGRYRPSQ